MIKIEQNNEEKFKEFVLKGLVENNAKKCKWFRDNPLSDEDRYENFLVYDDEKLVGGAIGYILYEWYFLDLLWIEDAYRAQKIGTNLIKQVEKYVKEEKLIGIRLETWDFQAKEFYEKMGYELYATIEDCPPGTINYFFKKRFQESKK